jgi:hypothetical protein
MPLPVSVSGAAMNNQSGMLGLKTKLLFDIKNCH